MMIYRKFVEINEFEGATWNWWLQTDGNEIAMAHLSAWLQKRHEEEPYDYPYKLTEDVVLESEVDVLVKYADENYYPDHNKVSGTLTLPDVLDDDFEAKLYKGGIRDFFKSDEERAA